MCMSSSNVNHLSHPSISERKSGFMNWLRKFFKKLFNCCACIWGDSTYGHQPQDDRPLANKEKEELLDEADKPDSAGYRRQTDIDEDVARTCAGCKRDIGNGNYLECKGTFYHPECCRCQKCGNAITEHEFFLSKGDTYHKSCFKEFNHPKCDVCHQFLPTDELGMVDYRCHPFWSQKYCPSHERDNTARCCSCERLESRDNRYMPLEDGRSLCSECTESAIMDMGDCQPLYHGIRDFYEGMNMRIDQQIPLLLVLRQALNEAGEKEKDGFRHTEARGLCLSEELTVASIQSRPRMERGDLAVRTQPQKLTRKREVTAILVLYGFPRLLTGAILAHELMHAWLRLNGYRRLRPEIEEGICQVVSHMWLTSEVNPTFARSSGGKSSVEPKLGEFFMHQIANDVSPSYGGGYRAAAAAVSKFGLSSTLDHVRYMGTFPQ